MVILHDAITTIENGFLCFLKKEEKHVSFQKKTKKFEFIKTAKKQVGCFFKQTGFSQS